MRTLRITLVAICLSACESKNYQFEGSLTEDWVEKLNQVPTGATIIIKNNGGGDPDLGEAVAKLIEQKDLSIILDGYCLSSCAEYIFVSARHVSSKNAWIGFHQSPEIFNRFNATSKPLCRYEDNLEYYSSLWERRLPNFSISDHVLKVLNIEGQVSLLPKCALVELRLEHEMWIPNATQLRDWFHVDNVDDYCVSELGCINQYVDLLFDEGQTVVFGQGIITAE